MLLPVRPIIPLNRYVYDGSLNAARDAAGNDLKTGPGYDLPIYHCPSDVGYPDHPDIDDSPRANALRSCYDTLGNSYRGSLYGYHNANTAFALGPWGHRMSTLHAPARLILMGEPTFFNMIGRDSGGNTDEVVVNGWHKRKLIDNLIFADGSARPTRATRHASEGVNQTLGGMMGLTGNNITLISRGPTWTFDTYPTPGAFIRGSLPPATGNPPAEWPMRNFQNNMR